VDSNYILTFDETKRNVQINLDLDDYILKNNVENP
jgi:hypothetical protein